MTRKEIDQAEKAIELTTYNQTIQSLNQNCGVAAVRVTLHERYKRWQASKLSS